MNKEISKMKKHMLAWLLITFLSMLFLNGCSRSIPPPPLKQFDTITIARFATVEETADMEMRIPLDLGTRLELKLKDSAKVKWVYDKSETLNPVEKKLNENNVSPSDIFTDPKLAARIGKDLGADIIVVGFIKKPKLRIDDSDKQYTRPGTASMAGSKRYTLWEQYAIMDVQLKIVDTQLGKTIWNDEITGYTKYIKAFQAQTPERNPVPENVVIAQLRDHIVDRMAHALFPAYPDRETPDLLMKPDVKLMDAGGVVQYK